MLTSDAYSLSFRSANPQTYPNFARDILFLPLYYRRFRFSYSI
jgi:hypothetical protein